MRNFKDIILEKLKVSTNYIELPYLEDFEEAVYNFNNAHEIAFEEIDSKYRDINNLPKYIDKNIVYNIISVYEAKHYDGRKYLYIIYSNPKKSFSKLNLMITSMNQLVELLGEELVLQIWDYIK
jgi:hypothetical protein